MFPLDSFSKELQNIGALIDSIFLYPVLQAERDIYFLLFCWNIFFPENVIVFLSCPLEIISFLLPRKDTCPKLLFFLWETKSCF